MPIAPSFIWRVPHELTQQEKEFFKRAWPDGNLPEESLIVGNPGVDPCAVTVPDGRVWDWMLFTPQGEITQQGWEWVEVDVKLKVAAFVGPLQAA